MVKVLIVDSDQQVALDYGGYLGQFGYEVEQALDGEEGLEKVRKNKPDIIISEIELPKLDGISLLEILKKDGLPWLKGGVYEAKAHLFYYFLGICPDNDYFAFYCLF